MATVGLIDPRVGLLVHQSPTESELAAFRHRVNRGTPVDDQRWIESTSKHVNSLLGSELNTGYNRRIQRIEVMESP